MNEINDPFSSRLTWKGVSFGYRHTVQEFNLSIKVREINGSSKLQIVRR